jgi:nucleoside 2-deoxyribosyltransferase
MRPLIYVAGPYTHPDPVKNTHKAVQAGLHLHECYDVAVIIPHLSIVAHLISPRDDEYWYGFDLALVAHCDGLVRLPGRSHGADIEVNYAIELGIPVWDDDAGLFYDDFGEWIDSLHVNLDADEASA